MQQNPSSPNVQKEKKENPRRDEILAKLKSFLFEHWGTKLLALFIAIALWAGLITQDPNLTREKQFTDVSVNVTGADTLRRNGFIVLEELDSLADDFTLRVNVPQGQYSAAQASNYNLRLDLSKIKAAGEQSVKVQFTNSSTYGRVSEVVPPSVSLTVDQYVTRYRIPVMVVPTGDMPEGFYATTPSTNPPMVTISGPKTIVEKIASVQVEADQSALPAQEGTVRRAMPFVLVDAAGAPVEHDLIQVTNESVLLDSVIVEQTLYTKRTVEMSAVGLVNGQPAEGYEVKGVYVTPSEVTIAGRADDIKNIDLLYANNSVDVTDLKDSTSKIFLLRSSNVIKYASTDVVTVAVEIGPIITGRAYVAPIRLENLPIYLMETSGMQSATVYIRGAQYWLDSLSSADVSVFSDLSNITEAGTYEVPLNCVVQGGEGQSYTCDIMPETVMITIEKR